MHNLETQNIWHKDKKIVHMFHKGEKRIKQN